MNSRISDAQRGGPWTISPSAGRPPRSAARRPTASKWNLCAGSPKREPRPSPKGAGSREPSWWEYEGVVMAEGSTVATHATRQRFPHGIETVRHALLKVPNHPGLAPKDRDRKGLVGCPS